MAFCTRFSHRLGGEKCKEGISERIDTLPTDLMNIVDEYTPSKLIIEKTIKAPNDPKRCYNLVLLPLSNAICMKFYEVDETVLFVVYSLTDSTTKQFTGMASESDGGITTIEIAKDLISMIFESVSSKKTMVEMWDISGETTAVLRKTGEIKRYVHFSSHRWVVLRPKVIAIHSYEQGLLVVFDMERMRVTRRIPHRGWVFKLCATNRNDGIDLLVVDIDDTIHALDTTMCIWKWKVSSPMLVDLFMMNKNQEIYVHESSRYGNNISFTRNNKIHVLEALSGVEKHSKEYNYDTTLYGYDDTKVYPISDRHIAVMCTEDNKMHIQDRNLETIQTLAIPSSPGLEQVIVDFVGDDKHMIAHDCAMRYAPSYVHVMKLDQFVPTPEAISVVTESKSISNLIQLQ